MAEAAGLHVDAPVREQPVVDEITVSVYETAVGHGFLDESDPAYALGTPHRAAVELLTSIGLLEHDDELRRYRPLDPTGASVRLVVPLARRGSELLAESARWNDTLSRLALAYRSSSIAQQPPVTDVRGLHAINDFIDDRLAECRVEVLTAQPYGRRRATTLAQAEPRDMQALARGVSMRTLYQHSARQSPATRSHVAEVGTAGAEIRTSDEFFKRLLIFDRHTALIPAVDDHTVALAVHEPSVVAYLLDLFERAWDRALPFTIGSGEVARTVAAEVRAMTLRMLVEGHSDAASAKRLGVSARTYASYISALKEEFGVQTRFQLGWTMSQTREPWRDD